MRPIRAILFAVLSAIVASTIAYFAFIRPRIRIWGLDPIEADLPMPGDELIADPSATETRGITIDAPVAKVWPWLVQMGFERGGWYSYDALDTRHPPAERILPEFQSLNPGDMMPYGPGTGFRVEVVKPESELVLYVDADLARRQAEQAIDQGILPEEASRASYPEFSASWAFYLKPIGDDKTRLVERFRARMPGAGPVKAVMGEIMGTGLVLMGRKQMLGIKERVERQDWPIEEPLPVFAGEAVPVG